MLREVNALVLMSILLLSCQQGSNSSKVNAVYDRDHRPLNISEVNSGKVAWRPLNKITDGLTGIGVLNLPLIFTNQDICTIFLIDTHVDSGPAYVMTNAHCTLHHLLFNPLGPTEFRTTEDTSFEAIFNHFVDVPASDRKHYTLEKLVYYTEFGTDLALFRLENSLGQMKADGIQPLTLATSIPSAGTKVQLVGVPLLRVPQDERSLHITDTCELSGTVTLRNGAYTAPRSVIHNCSSIEGFSGAPLMDVNTREVVLLNSHGDAGDSHDAPCTYASQPCEVDRDGSVHLEPTRNYGQYLVPLSGCFDNLGKFDLRAPHCALPH
jgi:Trypsin-like peptidase domain